MVEKWFFLMIATRLTGLKNWMIKSNLAASHNPEFLGDAFLLESRLNSASTSNAGVCKA